MPVYTLQVYVETLGTELISAAEVLLLTKENHYQWYLCYFSPSPGSLEECKSIKFSVYLDDSTSLLMKCTIIILVSSA